MHEKQPEAMRPKYPEEILLERMQELVETITSTTCVFQELTETADRVNRDVHVEQQKQAFFDKRSRQKPKYKNDPMRAAPKYHRRKT